MSKKLKNENDKKEEGSEEEKNLMLEKNKSKNDKKKKKGGKVDGVVGGKVSFLGRLDSCNACIRYLLVLGNCIFFFLGCTIIGLGIYVVVDKVAFITGLFGMTLVAPASYMILASGCVVFIVSFIGCFGALFESRYLLAIYSGFLAVVLTLSCIGFSLALIFRATVTDQIHLFMSRTVLYDYGINLHQSWNEFVTKKWDQAQIKWQCCAVQDNSWRLYSQSAWYRNKVKKAIKKYQDNNYNFHKNNINYFVNDDNNNKNNASGEDNYDYNYEEYEEVDNINITHLLHYIYNTNFNKNENESNNLFSSNITEIAAKTPLLPRSCCKTNKKNKICMNGLSFFIQNSIHPSNSSNPFTSSINTKGCYGEGTAVMHEISRYLMCIGVITTVVVIGGLATSIHLARNV